MRSLMALLFTLLAASACAQVHLNFAENARAFVKPLGDLKKAGILIGYPDGLIYGRGLTSRYECAVMTHVAWQNLRKFVGFDSDGNRTLSALKTDELRLLARWFPLVEGLLHDLGIELEYLGLSKSTVASQIVETERAYAAMGVTLQRSAGGRFSDLPVGHWAEKEVLALRRLGLLNGYPDGTF
jgi:hypothetical protein